MIAIHLHGRLRDLVDPALLPLRLDVRSPAEAYFALRSQLPGFETMIREGNWSYLVDDETPVTQDQVGLALPAGADLHIYPVAEGSGFIIDFFVGIFSFIGSLFFPSIKDYGFDQADERASYLFNGAVNTRAQGGPVPLVFGGPIKVGSYTISAGVTSARLTPPRKNLPSKVKGKAAEFENTLQTGATIRIVDLISEGEIEGLVDGARSVFLDGVPVQDKDGNEVVAVGAPAPSAADFRLPYGAIGAGYHAGGGAAAPGNSNLKGVKIDDRNGTGSQDPLDGIPAIEAERVVEQRVTRTTPQVQTITNADVDTVRVTLRFPALVHVNKGGDRVAARVSFAIDVQARGESDYTTKLNQDLHDKNISPAEISYEIPLEGAAPWKIRVRRLTADSDSDRTQDQTWWARLTEIREIRQTYPHSAVVSIVAEAEEYTGNIQKREYLVKGLKVDVPSNYDPATRKYTGIWNGRFKKAWTDNGAWCFYHMLVNRRFGLGGDIDQAYLDAVKWDLYTIAQFNDSVISYVAGGPPGFRDNFEFVRVATEPRFRFTGVVQKAADARKLLDNMLSNFHAAAYYSGGAVVAAQDSPSDPEALLTNSNVEDGDFHYADVPWSDRVSVVAVTFNDPLDDYRLGIELVTDNDLVAKYGYKKRDVVAMFCTSRGQANRFGRLLLYEQEHESDTLTCRTGMDQATLRPGAVVRQADRLVAAGRTGVRVAGYDRQARRLTLDDLTTLQNAGKKGWTINVVLEDGTVARRSVTSFKVRAHTVVVDQALDPPPAPGAVAVLEKASVSARLWRALSVKEIGGDGLGYELALKAYHPDKYDAVENDVNVVTPDYRLDETERYRALPAPGRVGLTAGQVQEGYTVRDTLTISVTLPRGESDLIDYELRGPYLAGAEADAAWTPVGRLAARTYEVPGTFPAGTYRARARTVSRNLTAVGVWVESGTVTLAGVSARPVTSRRLSYDTFAASGAVDDDGEFRVQSANGNSVHDTPAEILAEATPRLLLATTDADGVDRTGLFEALSAGETLVLSHPAGWWLAWRLDSARVQGATATLALSLSGSFGARGNVTPLAGQTVEVGISSAAAGKDGVPGVAGIRGLSGYVKEVPLKNFEATLAGVNQDKDWHIPSTDISAAGWTANDVDVYFITDNAGDQQILDFLEPGALVTLYIDNNNWGDYQFGGISLEDNRYHLSGMTLVESTGDMATDKGLAIHLTAANVVYRNLWSGTANVLISGYLTPDDYAPIRLDLPDNVDINDYDHIVITIYLGAHATVEMLVSNILEIGQAATSLGDVVTSAARLSGGPGANPYYMTFSKAINGSYLLVGAAGPTNRTQQFVTLYSIDAIKKSLRAGAQILNARLVLFDAGTVKVAKGSSRVFNFSIGIPVSGDVVVTCTLSGRSNFLNDVSFAASSRVGKTSVTIRAGDTAGGVTVFSRDDSRNKVTLTVETNSDLVLADARSDTVLIDPVAVSLDFVDSGPIYLAEGQSYVVHWGLSVPVRSNVLVRFAISGKGELSFTPASVLRGKQATILAGQTAGPPITVYAREDSDADNEYVNLSMATDSTLVRWQDDRLSFALLDNDLVTTTTWTLSPSSDQNITEDDSLVFSVSLAKRLSAPVTFNLKLTGVGAGSNLSFFGGVAIATRSFAAGTTTFTFRVYAKNKDSTDAATLTVSTNSALITGTKSRSVDLDVAARPATLVYQATVTVGIAGNLTYRIKGYASKSAGNIGSIRPTKGSMPVERVTTITADNNQTQGSFILRMSKGTANSDSTFKRVEITVGSKSSSWARTAMTYSAKLASTEQTQWSVGPVPVINIGQSGSTFILRFYR